MTGNISLLVLLFEMFSSSVVEHLNFQRCFYLFNLRCKVDAAVIIRDSLCALNDFSFFVKLCNIVVCFV